jgi:radical SAM family uncharacterized protein/radical SAM-linked protein
LPKFLRGWYGLLVNLLTSQKPSRYINREFNAIHKKAPLTFALAFPDLYEIGMSHLGLKILYNIINNIPYASAERVFSPWIDHEELMRKNNRLLSSLESDRPLRDFDIVGFSLQYELSYTTVLNMLELGGIPVSSEERMDSGAYPLIIAGGPCTVNPAPMSEFIDAFLIGDAEDAIHEMVSCYRQWKNNGQENIHSLLKALSEIEGVYVPLLGKEKNIHRRFIASLDDAPFPIKPIVPFAHIVHDRINIEVSRGCSLGCRFCQAGMIYRPVRERSPENVLDLARRSLKHTGYDSISFTSLSAGDYSCLPQLLKACIRNFSEKKIAISLPSLRVATVNREILREIKTVRKTGFTIAPEAGTARLRSVINKDFSEDDFKNALEALFSEGWQNLKLYFMTGLPSETDADIKAIPEMVFRALRMSRKLTKRRAQISVGISAFVPKPHTPFQWCGQADLSVLQEKSNYLKRQLIRKGIKYKGNDERMSLLEAAFARGDERLSRLIASAWKLGCRLDAWSEMFDFSQWHKAMDISGIDVRDYAMRAYTEESKLPWEHISPGISNTFLWKEYENALSATYTRDCRQHCHNCGLSCQKIKCSIDDGSIKRIGEKDEIPGDGKNKACSAVEGTPIQIRLEYSKTGMARYLSHLELTAALIRAMRRAEFPFRYSEGFHPAPKISFGPALRVGVAGRREYLDLELIAPVDIEKAREALNRTLPEGIQANGMERLTGREKSLNSSIIKYVYEVRYGSDFDAKGFMDKTKIMVQRKNKEINIRSMVEDLNVIDKRTMRVTICDLGSLKARIDEIMQALFGLPVEQLDITRIAMYSTSGNKTGSPAEEKKWAVRS